MHKGVLFFDVCHPPTAESRSVLPEQVRLRRLKKVTRGDERWGDGRRRIGRDRMARNAAVALGNSANPAAVLPELRVLAAAEPQPMVREHLQWAIDRLERSQEHIEPTQTGV